MADHSNDVTIHGYPPVGHISQLSGAGASKSEHQNLPYDQHGCVDWKELRARQLRSYSTDELKAELARREVSP